MYETTYNPNSKWDYWAVGGRWEGAFGDGECQDYPYGNFALVEELISREIIPFAVVTPDGEWHERGRMGWWGIVTDEKPDAAWKEMVLDIYRKYPNYLAVACDLHI